MSLKLMFITNDLPVALIAQRYGVDRIWIDLETLGKAERQHNMDTVKSFHSVSDIAKIAPRLTTSQMLVRVNPWHDGSIEEINSVIEAGAELVMLPMWKTPDEVRVFIEAVNKRAKTVLLLETKEAVECLDSVLELTGVDEVHIGLNDLHLSYHLSFMFELLADGTVENICRKLRKRNIPYGFGGIAKLGEGLLPAERIIMEHYRLGSTRAILSRSFCNTATVSSIEEVENIFRDNMQLLREYEASLLGLSDEVYLQNKAELKACVEKIAVRKKDSCI